MSSTATKPTDDTVSPAAPSQQSRSLLGRFAVHFANSPVSFKITLPDGTVQRFGPAEPRFHVALKNKRALRAISSIDEGRIGDAYLAGDIDIEGDMLAPFELRGSMNDFHLITTVWRFIQPLLFGQVYTNRQAITAHYDIDPAFVLSFLDPKTPCYTQGVYVDQGETLDIATLRKFEY
jgi:cyclopropane-fatty-acyl-phospholipid synthase